MARYYGNVVGNWQTVLDVNMSLTETAYTATSVTGSFHSIGYGFDVDYNSGRISYSYPGGSNGLSNGSFYVHTDGGATADVAFQSVTNWPFTRTHAAYTAYISATMTMPDFEPGTSTATYSFTVPAKSHWNVTYKLEGGSNGPATQTKWYGETLATSTKKPTRAGYTFMGWATKSGGDVVYQPGQSYSYTTNAALTLYARWKTNTWAISYNANGGSGTVSAQTKYYGTDLTLRNGGYSRTGYDLAGWATSASGAKAYNLGGTYKQNAAATLYAAWTAKQVKVTFNANGGTIAKNSTQTFTYGKKNQAFADTGISRANYDMLGWSESKSATSRTYSTLSSVADSWINSHSPSVTLYAVWKLRYTAPTLELANCHRTDANGNADDEGTYGAVTARWSVCTIISGIAIKSLEVWYRARGATEWTKDASPDVSGTSGTTAISFGGGNLLTDASYEVYVRATDDSSNSGNATDRTTILATAFFTLDFTRGGHGIGMGAPSVDGYVTLGLPLAANRGIAYAGSKATYQMIRFIDNQADTSGNGVSIGGGGVAIIGSGESATATEQHMATGGEERTYVASDNAIVLRPGQNGGYTEANDATLGTSSFELPQTLILKKQSDASATAANWPALIVGGTHDQAHMEIDANEVIAKQNGTTGGPLYLNSGAGEVYAQGRRILSRQIATSSTSGAAYDAWEFAGMVFFSVTGYKLGGLAAWSNKAVVTLGDNWKAACTVMSPRLLANYDKDAYFQVNKGESKIYLVSGLGAATASDFTVNGFFCYPIAR